LSVPPKERIDLLLVRKGLAPSRAIAQALVMEGRVTLEGRRVDKPGARVEAGAELAVSSHPRPFVSRGGLKLEAALEAFRIDVSGLTVLDIGASTGGFTDCLLKRGAAKVFAVDVGHGQIDHALRTDPRVVVIERLNARFLTPESLPGPADMAVMDVSFISATLILPRIPPLLRGSDIIVLVKPQFEVGRGGVGRGGIVREPALWREAILTVVRGAGESGLLPEGIVPSPITGAEGNREFLLRLAKPAGGTAAAGPRTFEDLVEAAIGPPPSTEEIP